MKDLFVTKGVPVLMGVLFIFFVVFSSCKSCAAKKEEKVPVPPTIEERIKTYTDQNQVLTQNYQQLQAQQKQVEYQFVSNNGAIAELNQLKNQKK